MKTKKLFMLVDTNTDEDGETEVHRYIVEGGEADALRAAAEDGDMVYEITSTELLGKAKLVFDR